MADEPEYHPPSDDRDNLTEQTLQCWIWIIEGGQNPGQSPYVDRLIELIVKAAERGWLTAPDTYLSASRITELLTSRRPGIFEDPDRERQCEQVSERWEHWAELLKSALPARLIQIS